VLKTLQLNQAQAYLDCLIDALQGFDPLPQSFPGKHLRLAILHGYGEFPVVGLPVHARGLSFTCGRTPTRWPASS
jgi:hypothetical protein